MAGRALRTAIMRQLRRTNARARDHLGGAMEGFAEGFAIGQVPMFIANGLLGYPDPEFARDAHVFGGLGFGTIAALGGGVQGKRAVLRAMLDGSEGFNMRKSWAENTRDVNRAAKENMRKYIAYLQRVGFDEEADEAQEAYEMALKHRRGYRPKASRVDQFNTLAGRPGENAFDEESNTRLDYGLKQLEELERIRKIR